MKKISFLKSVLKSEKKRKRSQAVTEHSQTGAVAETVDAPVSIIEEEVSATKRLRLEQQTAIVVFDPSNPVFKLFREKGAIEPRLSREATSLSELPYEPGKLKIWWPESVAFSILKLTVNSGVPYALPWSKISFYEELFSRRVDKRAGLGYGNPDRVNIRVSGKEISRDPNPLKKHFVPSSSQSQSQSLDISGKQRLVDTLVDFLGAEKALGAKVSGSDGREQGSEGQAGVSARTQEVSSALVLERAEEPVIVEESIDAPVIEEAVAAPVIEEAVPATEEVVPEVEGEVPINEEVIPVIALAGELEEVAAETEGVAVEPILTGGEVLTVSVSGGTVPVSPAGGSHGTIPPESPPRSQLSMANLEYVVEKILMKKLTNNWSLETFKKRFEDTVARSKENKETNEQFAKSLNDMDKSLAAVKETTVDLLESCAGQQVFSNDLRSEIDSLTIDHGLLKIRTTDLESLGDQTTADVSANKAEIQNGVLTHTSFVEKHDFEHRAIDARIGSLEELRRFDNKSKDLRQSSEYGLAFMAGFQRCCEVLIAKNAFPRRMLKDETFMDLVMDKNILLQKLADKASQISPVGEGSQQQQQQQQQPFQQQTWQQRQSEQQQLARQHEDRQQARQQREAHERIELHRQQKAARGKKK